MLYPEFHSQMSRSAFSWKRFHVPGPIPGAAPLPWLKALLMSGCPHCHHRACTTWPRASQSGCWLCPSALGFGSWEMLFLWICLHFCSLVLCHGPACMWSWGWFGCISFIGAVLLGRGVQPDTCRKVHCFWEAARHPRLITPGGAGHFLSTFLIGALSREVYFAPHVVTGLSSMWGGQKPARGSSRVVPWCCKVGKVNVCCLSAGVQNTEG